MPNLYLSFVNIMKATAIIASCMFSTALWSQVPRQIVVVFEPKVEGELSDFEKRTVQRTIKEVLADTKMYRTIDDNAIKQAVKQLNIVNTETLFDKSKMQDFGKFIKADYICYSEIEQSKDDFNISISFYKVDIAEQINSGNTLAKLSSIDPNRAETIKNITSKLMGKVLGLTASIYGDALEGLDVVMNRINDNIMSKIRNSQAGNWPKLKKDHIIVVDFSRLKINPSKYDEDGELVNITGEIGFILRDQSGLELNNTYHVIRRGKGRDDKKGELMKKEEIPLLIEDELNYEVDLYANRRGKVKRLDKIIYNLTESIK